MDSRKQPNVADRLRRDLRRSRSAAPPEDRTIASGTIRRGVAEKLALPDLLGGMRPSRYILYTAENGELWVKFVARDGKVAGDSVVPGKNPSSRSVGAKVSAEPRVVDPRAFEPTKQSDAMLRALERGRAMIEQDLEAAGGTYSTRRVAAHLQITPQAVDKQRKAGKLLAVRDPEGHLRFPAFQFTRPAIRPHLARVLNRLRVDNPFVKLHWLLTADSSLGNRKPVDLLDRGDVESVLKAAEAFGEHAPG